MLRDTSFRVLATRGIDSSAHVAPRLALLLSGLITQHRFDLEIFFKPEDPAFATVA